MATLEPEDSDEIFRRMTEDLELDPRMISVVSVATLNEHELLTRFNAVKKELYDREELLHAKTDTGRDLQSEYHALLLELKKRKVM